MALGTRASSRVPEALGWIPAQNKTDAYIFQTCRSTTGPLLLDTGEERYRIEERRAKAPHNPHPLLEGFPHGVEQLISKERTGASSTEDVLAKWRAHPKGCVSLTVRSTRGQRRAIR